MSVRITRKQAASFLAYCNTQLLDADLADERRQILEEKAAFYRKALVGSCSECGRRLENPESIELGIGPECRQKVGAR